MSSPASSRVVPGLILSALSLLSAFLLFQVQPVISKFILPWFGGSPGVWTTCMLFFQVVLFAGYAYAHTLTLLPRKWQGVLHGLLLGAAIALLPICPADAWKPTGNEDPTSRILLLLMASVGLPYFVLSSTSPLVQVWFTRTTGGANPWRLYALSNIGSLAALLSYPLFFEVRWDVLEQTKLWSATFAAFAILSISGVWMDRRHAQQEAALPPPPTEATEDHPDWQRRILWMLLPALAVCVLLSATNHVCQDVAVIPFLWVVPLSLYLLTFIICFEHERWYARVPVLWAAPALAAAFIVCTEDRMQKQPFWSRLEHLLHNELQPLLNQVPGVDVNLASIDLTPDYIWQLGWSFGAVFLACMLCHGELTRLKPAPRRLTEFYLFMSAGGALGGLAVSLGAPRWFNTFAEWPLSLIAVFIVGCIVLLRAVLRVRRPWGEWSLAILLAALTAGLGWLFMRLEIMTPGMIKESLDTMPGRMPVEILWVVLGTIALCVGILCFRAIRHGRFRMALVSLLLLGRV